MRALARASSCGRGLGIVYGGALDALAGWEAPSITKWLDRDER